MGTHNSSSDFWNISVKKLLLDQYKNVLNDIEMPINFDLRQRYFYLFYFYFYLK